MISHRTLQRPREVSLTTRCSKVTSQMPDEYDQLDELLDKLTASPALSKAWHASSAIGYSYAWYLLNHSWKLSPEVPRNYIPHSPRLRLWDDAIGCTENNPYTLAVFRGFDEPTRCRHAIWHCKQNGEYKKWFIEFFENGGQVQFHEPNITVRDADVPLDELNQHLRAIAAHKVTAISFQPQSETSTSTYSGSLGFDYFSQDQPPAGITYKWSHRAPRDWKPVIAEIEKLRKFLFSCFK